MVEVFYGKIVPVQWFRARRGGEEIDIILGLCPGGKAAKTILRHVGRRVPEGQSDGTALKDSQGPVPNLESSRSIGGTIERHRIPVETAYYQSRSITRLSTKRHLERRAVDGRLTSSTKALGPEEALS